LRRRAAHVGAVRRARVYRGFGSARRNLTLAWHARRLP